MALGAKGVVSVASPIIGKEIKLVAPDHVNADKFVEFVENL